MLGQLGIFPPTPAAGLKLFTFKLTGKAERAAQEVSRAAEKAGTAARSTA